MAKAKSSSSREYYVWAAMKQRCDNPKNKAFENYGGRGIAVCKRWARSFANFIADMGPKPTPEHSLERENNNGNYEPSNCYWATRSEQSRNRRSNIQITIDGKTQCLQDWCNEYGINRKTVLSRIESQRWDIERAIKEPPNTTIRHNSKMLCLNGVTKSLPQWSRLTGMSQNVIKARLFRGWSVEKSLTEPVKKRSR